MQTDEELCQLSATEAQKLILANRLTVEKYITALISRIESRRPINKAWVHLDPALILAQARKLDQLPQSARGPLYGIPIGIKDTILTRDMPTQYNSPIFSDAIASGVDAACVRILRAAGAVIFGKTTTTEFAATTEGDIHQNRTSNAHDANRTPGGSSSGSAVAVADFQVPLALGTQTAGSVVRPASFNGVYGIKWTWGAASLEGVVQYSVTNDTLGVFARSVEDLKLVSKVMRIIDPGISGELHNGFALSRARIGFGKTHVWPEAEDDLVQIWETAKDLLRGAGAAVEEVQLPDDFANISAWHAKVLAGDGSSSFLAPYLMDKDKLASFLSGYVENVKNVSQADLLEAYDGCARLRPVWDNIASKYDAVITPSIPGQAPVGLGYTGNACFNAMWTILHGPTINVPGLKGKDGMPIGLTIAGGRYCDLKVIDAAESIGQVLNSKR